MYYPYFRGKQFELILLRDSADFLAENNIHPIIEPVKSNFSALTRAMKALNANSVNCTLVINPKSGQEPVPTSDILLRLIDDAFKGYENISVGYILDAKSDIDDLVTILQQYHNFTFSIIHYGHSKSKRLDIAIKDFTNIKTHVFIESYSGKLYRKHLKKAGIKRVLIRDGFKPQRRNADYPYTEHFSELHITYPDEGMDGFGDYLTVGDYYMEGGGPAYAVAIHITYLDDDDDMFIYHFLSNRRDSPVDPRGKFLEAMEKLVKELVKEVDMGNNIFKSKACSEYLEIFEKKHYPGLGYAKKLSMQHHIELISKYLNKKD